jgi:hypothetical protein
MMYDVTDDVTYTSASPRNRIRYSTHRRVPLCAITKYSPAYCPPSLFFHFLFIRNGNKNKYPVIKEDTYQLFKVNSIRKAANSEENTKIERS